MKNKAVKTYLDNAIYIKLAQEAHIRNKSHSETIQCCLQEYLHLRREMASVFEIPGRISKTHSGEIIHTLLARTELKIADLIQALERKIDAVSSQVNHSIMSIEKMSLALEQLTSNSKQPFTNDIEKIKH